MAPNVINPNKIKMTSAGVVATANLIMRTTIDRRGILMSVTTTLLESADILVSSWVFRTKPATDSDRKRPLIPIDSGHPFRRKAATPS
jgi:hypothetical protein